MAIKCPKCQAENPEDTNFCGKCATPLKSPPKQTFKATNILPKPVQGLSKLSHIAGKYRILEEIGRGGMGVVYKAEDTTLNRRIAIKVLPDLFTSDPERMARFEREARVLASLNHPNIAAIYGFDKTDEKRFIVLEFVEGETLAKRLDRGPLSVEETLDVCRQISEGIEGAHEKGIIHRDLKPANIKITPEGIVKILDFGLAKAFQEDPSGVDPSQSPAITDEMTRLGVIMGTAAYMSPEQAKGKAVDKKADIWAFGCILFECLTGERAFSGDSATEAMAKILEVEPDWDVLPKNLPLNVRAVLGRCLQKDPKERLHDIADARIDITEALNQPPGPDMAADRKHYRAWVLGALVGGPLLAGAAALISWHLKPAAPSPITIRSVLNTQLPDFTLRNVHYKPNRRNP